MVNQLIIRDFHLQPGDKVKAGNQIFEYIKTDGAYSKYKLEDGQVGTGTFGYLIKEGEFFIPYRKDRNDII